MEFKYCKLEIFLPPTHLEVVQKALQEVDAGHIGNYDSCMELKVEVTVYTENVDKTIEAVKKVHPYEEPVINVIPLWRTSF